MSCFLRISLILVTFLICFSSIADERPNIVVILADDLGIGDVGAYGGEAIHTPHIDQLAKEGILFEQAYASHPVCSPSRAGMITGRYQQRHGWEYNPAMRVLESGMQTDQTTIAEVLSDVGYHTAMIGKWHLGHQPQYHPLSRGFAEFFGVLSGGSLFIDPSQVGVESIGKLPRQRNATNGVYDGFDLVKVDKYLTDVFTNKAEHLILNSDDKPFFLYLSHTTPHTPLQATEEYLAPYGHIKNPAARIYAAMVASLDRSVGVVVKALHEAGKLDNTLVVFSSDNGCAGYIRVCSNAPFAGYKRYHNEGGIRVPLVMRWGDKLKPQSYKSMVSQLDFMATFAQIAGSPYRTEDSVSLIDYLIERDDPPHEYLYWRSAPTQVIRNNRWKLIRYAKTHLNESNLDEARRVTPPADGWPTSAPLGYLTLLYDLEIDPGENVNLATEHPQIVQRLSAQFEHWNKSLPDRALLPGVRSTVTKIDGEWVQLIF
ncbi:MAG: sulfatase-like hydrolase/transferase [Pseudomonadota bacterium]